MVGCSVPLKFMSGRVVENIDAHTNVVYQRFKGLMGVSGRDFVNLVHWLVDPDGTLIIVAWSIEHPGEIRFRLHSRRLTGYVGGFVLRNKCKNVKC